MRVLVLEHHRWGAANRVGSHHVARILVDRGHEILWVSHPRSLLHRLLGPLPPQVLEHGREGVRELIPRVTLPYVGLPGLASRFWGRRWLRVGSSFEALLVREGGVDCDVVWLSDFTMLPALDVVRAGRVVWRFFDRLRHFSRVPASIFDLVEQYKPRAHLVLASSRVLKDDLERRGLDAVYVPNGADVRSFDAPPRPPDAEPRVVYIGALDSWFDLETVEHWAAAMPGVLFELGGENPRRLRSRLPNVRFRGAVEPGALCGFLAGARFGLIPFHRTELTLGVHPIKLYDYLAAGCPVLSVDLPEVEPNSEGVFTYRTAEEGLVVLRRHLDTPFDRDGLQRLARESRWEARLEPVFARLGL